MSERFACPIWECIRPESLAKLIQMQYKLYGIKLELLTQPDLSGIEPLEEIDRLMRQKPRSRRSSG